MEAPFWNLYREVTKWRLGMSHDLREVRELLGELERTLRKEDDMTRTAMASKYSSQITKLTTELKETLSDPVMRGLYDKVFGNLLTQPPTRKTTRIFEEFICGITLFAHEAPTTRPAYHRLASCGPPGGHGAAFRSTHLQCRPGMSMDERDTISKRVRICYLERLIYDAMYRHHMLHIPSDLESATLGPLQDTGHRYWLSEIAGDYRSCFPGQDMTVVLRYEGDYPIALEIQEKVDGRVTATETYVKQVRWDDGRYEYEDVVECERRVDDQVWARIQLYDLEPEPWVPTQKLALPLPPEALGSSEPGAPYRARMTRARTRRRKDRRKKSQTR